MWLQILKAKEESWEQLENMQSARDKEKLLKERGKLEELLDLTPSGNCYAIAFMAYLTKWPDVYVAGRLRGR